MLRLPWQKKGKLLPEKLALIDESMRLKTFDSIADLGGVWGVQGGYLFYALEHYHPKRAVMVDTHPTPEFLDKAGAYPALQVIKGNFGEPETAMRVGKVGAVLLFDVLLHQVKPDWHEVIRTYAGIADCLIVYNQQWVGAAPTKRLLELGEKEYFRNVPHKRSQQAYADLFRKLDEKHPHHERAWRDVHHIWQWGITDDDLVGVAESCGLKTRFHANYGRFAGLRNFENHGFVFCR